MAISITQGSFAGNFLHADPGTGSDVMFRNDNYSQEYNVACVPAYLDYKNYESALARAHYTHDLAPCATAVAKFYDDLGLMADAYEKDEKNNLYGTEGLLELQDLANKLQLIPEDLSTLQYDSPFPTDLNLKNIEDTISNPISSTDGMVEMDAQGPQWNLVTVCTDEDALENNQRFIQNAAGQPQFTQSDLNNRQMAWAPAQSNLFNTKPNPGDVIQGNLGDCWYMAALQSIANTPSGQQFLANSIKPVPGKPSQYNVTFDAKAMNNAMVRLGHPPFPLFNGLDTVQITVNDALPTYNGNFAYGQVVNGTDWAAIYEKAAAKFFSFERIAPSGGSTLGYQSLVGGYPALAYAAITGDANVTVQDMASYSQVTLAQKISSVMNSNGSVWVSANKGANTGDPQLLTAHAYSVMQFVAPTDPTFIPCAPITLRDPHGKYLTMPFADFYRAFVQNGAGGEMQYTGAGRTWNPAQPSNTTNDDLPGTMQTIGVGVSPSPGTTDSPDNWG